MTHEYKAGDRLCACTLLRKCGEGGCGEVWLAEDDIGARVALKILVGRHSEREVAGLKNYKDCDHPNLLRIRHVEISGESICYTMDAADDLNRGAGEYLPDTLANRLNRYGRLDGAEVAAMLDGLLSGLEELHSKGLVHRDIKPDNILWVNGRVVLSDAGLVAPAGKHTLVGSPGFISPRLLETDGVAGPGDDFYALSKVVYCALTGLPPGEYPSIPPDMTISVDPRLSRALRAGCSRRIGSSAEFRKVIAAPDLPRPPRAETEKRSAAATSRKPRVVAFAAAVAAAVVAGVAFRIVRSGNMEHENPAKDRETAKDPPARTERSPIPDRDAEFRRDRAERAKRWFRRFGLLEGARLRELLTRRVFAKQDIEPELERLLDRYPNGKSFHELFQFKLMSFDAPDAAEIEARQRHWRARRGKPENIASRMLAEDPVMQAAAVNMLLEQFCRLVLEKREFGGQLKENVEALIDLQSDFVDPDFGRVKYMSRSQEKQVSALKKE